MRKIALVIALVACAGHGRRMQTVAELTESDPSADLVKLSRLAGASFQALSLASVQSRSIAESGFRDAPGALQALAVLLLNPATAFNPCSLPTSNNALARRRARYCTVMTAGEEKDAAARAEQLRLQAEKAALAAEKARLELASLEAKLPEKPSKESDTAAPAKSLRIPGSSWTEGRGKYHRFIAEDDPSFEPYTNIGLGYTCETPTKFIGTRREGVSDGSFRLQFTLPWRGSQPKTIELLQTTTDNPTFGAVKVRLPLQVEINRVKAQGDPSNSRLVVAKVNGECKEDIRVGDFVRAVSLPEPKERKEDPPWWRKFVQIEDRPLPESEEGMVILDGKTFADFFRVLGEHADPKDKEKVLEVVFLIERAGGGV